MHILKKTAVLVLSLGLLCMFGCSTGSDSTSSAGGNGDSNIPRTLDVQVAGSEDTAIVLVEPVGSDFGLVLKNQTETISDVSWVSDNDEVVKVSNSAWIDCVATSSAGVVLTGTYGITATDTVGKKTYVKVFVVSENGFVKVTGEEQTPTSVTLGLEDVICLYAVDNDYAAYTWKIVDGDPADVLDVSENGVVSNKGKAMEEGATDTTANVTIEGTSVDDNAVVVYATVTADLVPATSPDEG